MRTGVYYFLLFFRHSLRSRCRRAVNYV